MLEICVSVVVKGVKNIIVVMLGKGGVGKFMMVVNFVFVIVKLGGKVGLLDVDIYGFLVLLMFGKIKVKLVVCDNKWM